MPLNKLVKRYGGKIKGKKALEAHSWNLSQDVFVIDTKPYDRGTGLGQMESLVRIRDTFKQDKETLNRILYPGELRVLQRREDAFLNAKKMQINGVNEQRKGAMARFAQVTKFMEGEVKQLRDVLETGVKNEEDLEALWREMNTEWDEGDVSLEHTILGIATRAKMQRLIALRNLPSLAKTFGKYVDEENRMLKGIHALKRGRSTLAQYLSKENNENNEQ